MLDSTDQVVATDADGRFTMDGILPGPYTLHSRDSVLTPSVRVDSAGTVHGDSHTQQLLSRDATVDIEVLLEVPNTADLTLARPCP